MQRQELRIGVDLTLVDGRLNALVGILDGIFNCHNATVTVVVDLVE